MHKHTGLTTGFLALALSILLGTFGLLGSARPASAHPQAQGADLVAAALAYANAYDARDTTKLRDLADPAFQDVGHYGPPDQQVTNLDDFIKGNSGGPTVTLTNCRLTGANAVDCDGTLRGGPLPRLPHPWTEKNTLTFANGKVLRIDEYLTPQTAADLDAFMAAHPQPGMPSTGAPGAGLPLLAILVGLLLVAGGAVSRRAGAGAR